MLTWLLLTIYFTIGIIKLKFFDRNKEGDWLMLLSDERSRRCNIIWLYVFLFISWVTWPIAIFSKDICITEWFFRFQWNYM